MYKLILSCLHYSDEKSPEFRRDDHDEFNETSE